ncbi:MAG: hypothetical protein ACN4GF_08955 [Lentimonas sp.]
MDRTAFKQQSFAQAAEHQAAYRAKSDGKQSEDFEYLMGVAFGFVGQPRPKMEKQRFSISRRP